jgi:hypothetical protein
MRRKEILVAWKKEDIVLQKKMGKVMRYGCGVQCVLSATRGDICHFYYKRRLAS